MGSPLRSKNDQSGIALFMVIAAMTVLSVLVTEFTYVAHVNSRMSFDNADQVRAHYLAKAGLKLSLLRLKAYQTINSLSSGSGIPTLPKNIKEQIWSFPFAFPIPKNVPGMSIQAKERIEEFEKESSLSGGSFTALIASESSKYNLNAILPTFAPKITTSPSPSPTSGGSSVGRASPSPSPSTLPFDPKAAQQSLRDLFEQILAQKVEKDPDFEAEYRDFKLDDFMDNLLAWGDYSYQPVTSGGRQEFAFKRAPFYSVNELRMIYPIDDTLFDLFSPHLTTFTTLGINVNTIDERMLKALVPGIKDEEVQEFFKFRDAPDQDNAFKTAGDFFQWLEKGVGALRGDTKDYQDKLKQRGVQIVTDESVFKVTVSAKVAKASRVLEAYVFLEPSKKTSGPPASAPPSGDVAAAQSPGLRILFMRAW